MKPTLITILVPAFQAGRWIEGCLESLVSQDDPALEILVLDGASRDDTAQVARSFGNPVRVVSEPDRGLAHAINRGLDLAKGEWFNWIGADDRLRPGALKSLRSRITEHPDALFIAGRMNRIDENDNPITDANREKNQFHPDPVAGRVDPTEALARLRPPLQPGGLFKTDAVKQAGGVDEALRFTMDVDLLLKLLLRGEIIQTDDVLVDFRKHTGQLSHGLDPAHAMERLHIVDNLATHGPEKISPALLRRMEKSAWRYAAGKHRTAGRPARAAWCRCRSLFG